MALRQQRNYQALNDAQRELDARAEEPAAASPEAQRGPLRSWTHYGGMVPQQESALLWVKQNYEIRMAANDRTGNSHDQDNTQSAERAQNEAELQEARETAEDARQREAERSREREQERGR